MGLPVISTSVSRNDERKRVLSRSAVVDDGVGPGVHQKAVPSRAGDHHHAEVRGELVEVGVTEDLIPAMSADAMKSGNILINPRQTTVKDIENLFLAAM